MPADRIASDSVASICIRAPNWVGDAVMAMPTFRCVRAYFPSARIVLVVREAIAPVLHGAPWFDHRVLLRGHPGRNTLAVGGLFRAIARIRREHCGLGFVLPNSFSSALMFYLAGVRRRVGYVRDARGFLLTYALRRPSKDGRFSPMYMVDYYLALCEKLGLEPHSRRTELHFTKQDAETTDILLREAGINTARPLFLLHPGAAFGPSKLWPLDRFAALAENLEAEFGAQVACIGAPQDSPLIRNITGISRAALVDLSTRGIDLHLLKCVVASSKLLVTTDSGPRHYGVALGVPTVCLMGPTHPGYSTSDRPWDHVVRADVECSPCQKKVCRLDHRCMEQLSTDTVLAACRKALQSEREHVLR